MDIIILFTIPLLVGWVLDRLFGDPSWLPHPIVYFGRIIAWGERKLNNGKNKQLKGALFALALIMSVFMVTILIDYELYLLSPYAVVCFNSVIIFYCLAGNTLIKEVRDVFIAVDKSVDDGRKQLSRIVGRDTSALSPQQIRTAALETLAENLSDGVVAPLFWYMILGIPGMLAYKMINTLDSMIGYKNDRYKQFGCIAAKIDDIANYIPARLTAFLMLVASGKFSVYHFVRKYSRCHASPNSGYPESALAGILNCRFGGPNMYFGRLVDKPYIGQNERELTSSDMQQAIKINKYSEMLMLLFILLYSLLLVFIFR